MTCDEMMGCQCRLVVAKLQGVCYDFSPLRHAWRVLECVDRAALHSSFLSSPGIVLHSTKGRLGPEPGGAVAILGCDAFTVLSSVLF